MFLCLNGVQNIKDMIHPASKMQSTWNLLTDSDWEPVRQGILAFSRDNNTGN